jgi:agmatine/peptidylarginine deiminase
MSKATSMKPYIFLTLSLLFSTQILFAQEITIPGESEKNEGIILKWNYNEAIDSTVAQIASIISTDDKVWILYDTNNVYSISAIQSQLLARGATLSNITFIDGTAETPWLRDFGPEAGYAVDDLGTTRHFVDNQYNPIQYPSADFIPVELASYFNFDYAAMPLNFEFGNVLLDGIGRGFVSDRVLTQNPGMSASQAIQLLYTKLGLNQIIIFPSVPECGGGEWAEISRLVKIVDPETVLVSQFPQNLPYYQQVEMIADSLANTPNDFGLNFKVFRLPVAPGANGEFSVTSNGEIRSYTSSILFNNKVIIPSYNSANDAVALNIYKQAFPGYHIYQISSQVLTLMHGSLYRLAVNIPQPKLFRIRHQKFSGMLPYESEIWMNALIQSTDPVDSIQVFYRIHPSATYQVVNTYGCCGGNSASITGFNSSDTVSYYLKAYGGGNAYPLPIAAPEVTYTFWFDPFTGLKPPSSADNISIFPNPASDRIFVKGIPKTNSESRYQILNLQGVLLAEDKIPGEQPIRLPESMVDGLYLVKILTTGESQICKLYLHH